MARYGFRLEELDRGGFGEELGCEFSLRGDLGK